MDSTLCYLFKRDGEDKDSDPKDTEYCGPVHRSGDCNYTNCRFTVDHYHCQMCGRGSTEISQAISHIRSSPSCRRDQQYSMLNDTSSALYNSIYGGISAQNTYGPSSYSSYGQLDSFQWHPSVPVDKMSICGPQLSPCFGASNNSRIQIDPSLCSPISDLYSKVAGPVKDLVGLPTKSNGLPSDSQSWFYNTQPMQVYKYVEQTSVPQINFLLLDPSVEHKDSALQPSDHLSYSCSNKTDCNSSLRELKESFLPYCSQQSMQLMSADDTSLFSLQINDENTSKTSELFSSEQSTAHTVCNGVNSKEGKDQTRGDTSTAVQSCCMLMDSAAAAHNDLNSFTHFESCTTSSNIPNGGSDDSASSGSDSDESDIVVEDTGDELSGITESEMTIETIKCSLLQEVGDVTDNVRKSDKNFPPLTLEVTKTTGISEPIQVGEEVLCAVCAEHSSGSVLIQLGTQLPVTSTSHSPVLSKLSQLVNITTSDFMETLGGFLCQRCLGLLDAVDSLETQLESARQNFLQIFKMAVKSGNSIISDDDLHLRSAQDEISTSNQTSSMMEDCEKVLEKVLPAIQDDCTGKGSSDEMSINQTDILKVIPEKQLGDVQEITLMATDLDEFAANLQEPPQSQSGIEEQPSLEQNTQEQAKPEDSSVKESEREKNFEFFCDLCGAGFLTEPELKSHCADHRQSDANFLCDICGRRFMYRHQQQIDRHLSQHFLPNRFFCDECNKGFKSSRALKEHSIIHSGDRPFSCPNCSRNFAHRSNMRAHLRICTGELPFRCDKCKAGFLQSDRLERHIALVHTGLAGLKCSQCDRTFGKLCDLKSHQRVHSTVRAYSCEVCGRSYKSLSNLNHHAKNHKNEKPYNCEICGQGFVRKDTWESHMFNHKGERPFKCNKCPKAFWSKENLSLHSKRHAGTHKKYTCPVCDKVFSQKLSVHMRTHTGARPYQCQKCAKSFSTGSSLNKHVLLKHPALTEEICAQ